MTTKRDKNEAMTTKSCKEEKGGNRTFPYAKKYGIQSKSEKIQLVIER